jgi:para-nitrobenzyl esterase
MLLPRGLSAFAVAPKVLDASLVKTPLGILRGEVIDEQVRIFRGVPYAAPPVGPLRFRPTEKLKPWQGTRDATKFAAAAIQSGDARTEHSEDCLYLNAWAPSSPGPHPVFVWFHAGGYTGGRSFSPEFNGHAFARDGVVFITIANRVGVLGYLDVEPLLSAAYPATANNALHDVIASLEWVQQNISSFGGDPASVTIGGESAGAKLAATLMGIPSAQSLFHQVISESGGAERILLQAQSAAVGKAFGDVWRDVAKTDVTELATADPAQILAAQARFLTTYQKHFPFRPEVDGSFIPRLSIETIAAGSTRGKRLLLGSNTDESVTYIGSHPTQDATGADLATLVPERFAPVYAKYKSVYPELSEEQRRIRSVSAEEYWVPSIRVIDAHVKGGGTGFMYRLDLASVGGRFPGFTYHGMDVPMIFTEPGKELQAGAFAALSTQMHQAWVAFIQGKTPAAPGLPVWQPYDAKTRPTLILDASSRMEQLPREQELRLWDGVI